MQILLVKQDKWRKKYTTLGINGSMLKWFKVFSSTFKKEISDEINAVIYNILTM